MPSVSNAVQQEVALIGSRARCLLGARRVEDFDDVTRIVDHLDFQPAIVS